MPIADIQAWWLLAVSVVSTVTAVAVFLRKPGEDAAKAVTELSRSVDDKINELKELVSGEVADMQTLSARLEERIAHLPSQRVVGDLAGDVKRIEAQIEGLTASQKTQTTVLNRIENWIMALSKT